MNKISINIVMKITVNLFIIVQIFIKERKFDSHWEFFIYKQNIIFASYILHNFANKPRAILSNKIKWYSRKTSNCVTRYFAQGEIWSNSTWNCTKFMTTSHSFVAEIAVEKFLESFSRNFQWSSLPNYN